MSATEQTPSHWLGTWCGQGGRAPGQGTPIGLLGYGPWGQDHHHLPSWAAGNQRRDARPHAPALWCGFCMQREEMEAWGVPPSGRAVCGQHGHACYVCVRQSMGTDRAGVANAPTQEQCGAPLPFPVFEFTRCLRGPTVCLGLLACFSTATKSIVFRKPNSPFPLGVSDLQKEPVVTLMCRILSPKYLI